MDENKKNTMEDESSLVHRINENKQKIIWDVLLGQDSKADFVMGYYYDPTSDMYCVYINNEHGRQSVRLRTKDKVTALEKLLSMIEFEIESKTSQ